MTERSDPTAASIAQARLEETGAAMMAGDFPRFARNFRLPKTITTAEGARLLTEEGDLRRVFDEICAFYADLGVTWLDRTVETAMFDGPDIIRYSHVTRMMNGDTLVRPPHYSHSVITLRDGEWRVSDSAYLVSGPDSARDALMKSGEPLDLEGEPEVRAIFQRNLDRMTSAYFLPDFDALLETVQFPLFKQGTRGTEIFADAEDLRRDFDRYRTQILVHRITDLVRTVKSAHMLGAGRIYGTYLTHVLSGTQLLMPSYASAVTLEQGTDSAWRLTSIMHPTDRPTLDRIAAAAPG